MSGRFNHCKIANAIALAQAFFDWMTCPCPELRLEARNDIRGDLLTQVARFHRCNFAFGAIERNLERITNAMACPLMVRMNMGEGVASHTMPLKRFEDTLLIAANTCINQRFSDQINVYHVLWKTRKLINSLD